MICKHILLITHLNKPRLIFLHKVKWFKVLLSKTDNYIDYKSFVCTHLNGFVCFFGISTIVGYLKPNPEYIYDL